MRRRPAVLLAGAAVLAAGAVALAAPPATVPLLTAPCALSSADGEAGLSRDEARAAADAAATALRDGTPLPPPSDDTGRAAAALAAGAQEALTCRTSRPARADEVEGSDGLTPRAQRLRAELEAAFGRQSLGGFAPGGVRSGHVEGSAHYDGRALDVFFRPVTPEGTARGWAVAQWAVAHADELDVATVIFDRRIWSAGRSAEGWRAYRHPSGDDENPVLAHEDHVHVDVAR